MVKAFLSFLMVLALAGCCFAQVAFNLDTKSEKLAVLKILYDNDMSRYVDERRSYSEMKELTRSYIMMKQAVMGNRK